MERFNFRLKQNRFSGRLIVNMHTFTIVTMKLFNTLEEEFV